MTRFIGLMLSAILLTALCACGRKPEPPPVTGVPSEGVSVVSEPKPSEDDSGMASISITIGASVYSAKLYDNETAAALLLRLPMTLNMSELNGNEKYNNLPDSLPADSQRVGSINAGDLMLYGSDCLVLFYESFTSNYNYTKIGYIENASGLAEALGQGSVEVEFTVSP